jgi:ferredoxin-type protein NapG
MERINRQEFFRQLFRKAVNKSLQVLDSTKLGGAIALASAGDPEQVVKVRPPGAHFSHHIFTQKCTGCDACMAACPVNVIMIEDMEKRLPVIFPQTASCIRCPGFPCVAACPTGALDLVNGSSLKSI